MSKTDPLKFKALRDLKRPAFAADLTDRERDILRLIRDEGPMSRAALIRTSGLTGPAIFRATEDMASKGLLQIGAPIAAGRGQPSHEVKLNPDAAYTLGISVMTDRAQAVIMDMTGAIRASADITAEGMKRSDILDKAALFLEDQCQQGLNPRAFVGTGLALAAFFVKDQTLNPAEPLNDWALVDLYQPLEAAFSLPTLIENSASAAAVGESLLGVGRHTPSFAYVNFAAGFGGGIILDRRLWRGQTGNAGEFAAILNAIGAFVPNLESLRSELSDKGIQTEDLQDLVTRFDVAWPGVETWIAKAAPSIRLLSRIIIETIDVGTIVIGGRIPPSLAERLAVAARITQAELDAVQRRHRGRPAPKIIAAEADARATAIGAAALPMSRFIFTPPHLR